MRDTRDAPEPTEVWAGAYFFFYPTVAECAPPAAEPGPALKSSSSFHNANNDRYILLLNGPKYKVTIYVQGHPPGLTFASYDDKIKLENFREQIYLQKKA